MKRKLRISFSGGRTSAYMMWWIWSNWQDKYDIIVIFANTGKEAEGTLEFVRECGIRWGIPIVWVEAMCIGDDGKTYSEKGWKVKHRIVSFETASRNGEPFEEMISVLGIPSTNSPFCSPQLKREAIESYASSVGFEDAYTAIGIRSDEVSRVPATFKEQKLLYPLIKDNPTPKWRILSWWDKQDFNLTIDPDEGNCDFCWKKDEKTLVRLARKKPEKFVWWQKMTDKYGYINPRNVELLPPFNFYRGNLSPKDFLALAKLPDNTIKIIFPNDSALPCADTCEAF